MDKIAVIIPCYNESLTVEKVINEWRTALPEAKIYVYDNNSDDGTAEIAKNAGAVVKHEYRQGKGNVIRSAFMEIDAKCYFTVDGDDTYPADCAKEMADMVLNKGVDMVVGDRLSTTYYDENKRRFHGLGNSLVKSTINSVFKSNIPDIMTGCRAFSYLFVKSFPVLSKGFEIETEMTIHAIDKNMYVESISIPYRDRPEGSESKLNTFGDGIKVIFTIGRLFRDYKPLAFFGLIASVLFFLAVLFFIPVFVEYVKTGLVPNFPTLIVCGFAVIAAIQSFFTGLILNTMRQKNRRDFEINLIEVKDKFKRLTENDG